MNAMSQESLPDGGPPKTSTSTRPLAELRRLVAHITARAPEIEAERGIPPDLIEALKSAGAFRLFVPHSAGGLELDLPAAVEAIATLARSDGSVGWNVMNASGCSLFAAMLPRETYERVYDNGPNTIIAGSNQPAGKAEAVGSGWRVSGRWPFVSGCRHADWMFGLCTLSRNGEALADGDGKPLVQGCFLPAQDWKIEDTWHVVGLKGTGSHHISLQEAIVPTAHFFDLVNGTPCQPGPLYRAPRQLLPALHGASSVGIAEGALDGLIAMAGTGRQQLKAALPMRDSETFQYELGRVAADVRAARAFLQVQATSHWRHALAGTLRDEALNIQGTQAAIWLAMTSVRVADACFTLGGGGAVYETSPLQRRLRDMHTAAQHATAHQRHYVGAGRLLLNPIG
jgi:alkylation response protein AidB-like acyl-CoA dehydrogenase